MSATIPLPTVDVPTCCGPASPPVSAAITKFHFALNVSDLERSVAFYRILFQQPPAKHYSDYAKFEVTQPPLVFSLVPNAPASSRALSHFGLSVTSKEDVAAAASRLEAAGLTTSCQENTVCGYARKSKVWVTDPDGNPWEIYVVHEDVGPAAAEADQPVGASLCLETRVAGAGRPTGGSPGTDGAVLSGASGVPSSPGHPVARESGDAEISRPPRLVWEHRVMQPLPERIPHNNAAVDEVRLEGTFNSALSEVERQNLLQEVRRVLKPGGAVLVHGLVSDRPLLSALPALPGVASLVKQVPVESEPLAELFAAGFINGAITKLPSRPAFRSGPIEMREIKIRAINPDCVPAAADTPLTVIYQGPFARATDEYGQVFVRGVRTPVTTATWQRIQQSSTAIQFVLLNRPRDTPAICATSCAGTN